MQIYADNWCSTVQDYAQEVIWATLLTDWPTQSIGFSPLAQSNEEITMASFLFSFLLWLEEYF